MNFCFSQKEKNNSEEQLTKSRMEIDKEIFNPKNSFD